MHGAEMSNTGLLENDFCIQQAYDGEQAVFIAIFYDSQTFFSQVDSGFSNVDLFPGAESLKKCALCFNANPQFHILTDRPNLLQRCLCFPCFTGNTTAAKQV